MTIKGDNSARFWGILSVILAAALFRLLPHPPNFSPITAMALFAGSMMIQKRWAIGAPLAAMILSDLALGFHETLIAVYGAIIVVALLGFVLRPQRSKGWAFAGNVGLATLSGSMVFFALTNFAVWAVSGMYERTWAGLVSCFAMAIPFLQNSLMSDFLFAGVFFGAWVLVERAVPSLRATARI